MNMKTNNLCRECGQPVPSDALLGLCPQCMMKARLPKPAKATIAVSPAAFVEGPETETKSFIPGTKLGYIGDYELLEEIARGGMGVVYKARQSSLKRIVAVKMIRSGELAGETEVKRFHSEAEAAAQLQHPNIVAIHEIGKHQGQHYFSMDFVEGKNLAQVANGKPVAARSAAEWLKAIAGAVQFAHQRGVLHRDLKPQNIMLDAAGQPRVMDFGLAKTLGGDSSVTNTGAVMGSPSYMSPEQALGRNDLVSPASDVYSLGAILYELLTGRPPFRGKTMLDTMSQVVNDEAPPPRSLNADAPVDLESICLKCLEKDPARRYPTARELEADLGRFLDGEPVQAKPANAFRKTVSWFRRHRWVLSAAVAVLMLTLAGLAYGLWEQTRFLIWHNANPSPVKTPASHAFELGWIFNPVVIGIWACFPMLGFVLKKLKARPFWNKISSLLNPWMPGEVAMHVGYGVLGIAFGLFLTADAIHTFIWEGGSPSWIIVVVVLVVSWGGMGHLTLAVRQQMQLPVVPPEYKASPQFHAALGAILLAVALLFSGLWMLSVPQPFSSDNLFPLVCGFLVAVTIRLALFLLRRGWPGMFASESSGSAPPHWAFPGMSRWIKFPLRFAIVSFALGLLLIDLVFLLAVFLTPDSHSSISHDRGFSICGLVFGGLVLFLIYFARKKKTPVAPRPEDKSAPAPPSPKPLASATPEPLSPAQLAPIQEAIFAGRTNDAFKLYHAANGANPNVKILDYKNLLKLESELKLSHPEKFAAGVLDRATKRAHRWGWLWRVSIMLVGLWIVFLPQYTLVWLVALLYGLGIGAFIRAMSSNKMEGWKGAYREMRQGIRYLAMVLIGFVVFGCAGFFLSVIGHPGMLLEPIVDFFLGGLVAGWLLVHLSQKKRKAP
jgi:tRNA A-37 threonylcarbamoyl transferase component Bud32